MEIVHTKVSGKTLKLAPVGDIQFGSHSCDIPKLKRHIEYGVAHDWKFLGMGDYLDHFSPSNRRALVAARGSLYDSARELLDDAVDSRIDGLISEALEPSRGSWLGMIQGDHAWDFEDGRHSDAVLAERLGAKFLETATILHVKVGRCPLPLRIFATHGAGSSVSATGKTLHLERLVRSFDADIYLMGHSHLKYGVPLDRFESVEMPDGTMALVNKTKIIGITGSFMSGYVQGASTYVEEKALSPVATGGLFIECKPVKETWGWRWDMFVTA